jgi:pyridoxal biosynthesis lyase PdxS
VNAATIEKSARLQQVYGLLRSRGDRGATTADILDACPKCKAVSPAIAELRDVYTNHCQICCERIRYPDCMIATYYLTGRLPPIPRPPRHPAPTSLSPHEALPPPAAAASALDCGAQGCLFGVRA